jgi:predicted NBD/HSP70 family sugar kinase
MKNLLSIDIGGTKVRVIIYSSTHTILQEFLLPTKEYLQKRGESDLRNLFDAIKNKINETSFETVGISMNCAIHEGKIIYSSLLGGSGDWNVQEIAVNYFETSKFIIDNDVYAMAKAENTYGIGMREKNFLFVNLGTGIRVVGVVNNTLIRGEASLAGEIGLDKIWIQEANKYTEVDNALAGRGIQNLAKIVFGKEMTAEEIFTKRDEEVIAVFIKYLTQFLHTATFFYNPAVIVFAGSVTNASSKWLDRVKEAYKNFEPDFILAKDILISELPHTASLGSITLDDRESL